MKNKIKQLPNILMHEQLAFLACLCILVGLFVSRAMMSIGMMTLLANAFIQTPFKKNFYNFWKDRNSILITVYFLLSAITYFWSEDKHYFMERMQILLPFLVLPFAFYAMPHCRLKWFDRLFIVFVLLCMGGCCWSLYHYFLHKEMYDEAYGLSQVLPTPFKNDHIRFSIAVLLSMYCCLDLAIRYKQKWIRIALTLCIIFFIVFLHIVAVKTGLIVFYLITFLFLGKLLFTTKNKGFALIGLSSILVLPFIMYSFSTSFRNKINYVKYSWEQMQNTEMQANISDEGRLISYRYALQSIALHPLLGVGIGDVKIEMEKKYAHDFAEKKATVLLPHNQFLVVGMGLGIGGILYLLLMQFSLFFWKKNKDFLYFSVWFTFFFTMMIEPLYETQYGTCLFLFFLLLVAKRPSEKRVVY